MILRGLWFSGTHVNACGDFFLPAPLPSPVSFLERVSYFLTQICFWDISDFHNVGKCVHNLYLLIVLNVPVWR